MKKNENWPRAVVYDIEYGICQYGDVRLTAADRIEMVALRAGA